MKKLWFGFFLVATALLVATCVTNSKSAPTAGGPAAVVATPQYVALGQWMTQKPRQGTPEIHTAYITEVTTSSFRWYIQFTGNDGRWKTAHYTRTRVVGRRWEGVASNPQMGPATWTADLVDPPHLEVHVLQMGKEVQFSSFFSEVFVTLSREESARTTGT